MGLAKMYELIGPAGVALILVAAAGLYLTIWTVIYLIRTGRGFRSTIHEAEADGGRRTAFPRADGGEPESARLRRPGSGFYAWIPFKRYPG